MPLSEAKSLCERVPDSRTIIPPKTVSPAAASPGTATTGCRLHDFEHEPARDREQLEGLALGCESFSPIVGLEQADAPSSLLLDITGLAHLFDGESSLCREVDRHFRQLGYSVQLAVAPTVGMAWACARHHDLLVASASRPQPAERLQDERLQDERLEDERLQDEWLQDNPAVMPEPSAPADADQTILIQSNHLSTGLPADAFDGLPISALRLPDTMVDTLEQLGIDEISQIAYLPRAGLRSRFGDELTLALDRAAGLREEVVVALPRPAEFSTEEFLEYPVSDRETIEVILSRQVEELCRQMASLQRGSLAWQFELTGPQHSRLDFQVDLFQPAVTAEHVMQLARMQLERNQQYCQMDRRRSKRRSSGSPSLSKGNRLKRARSQRTHQPGSFCFQNFVIRIPSTVLLAQRQTHLFDADAQPARQSLSHLVNTLSSRLGAENVLRAGLEAGARAENAARFERLVGSSRGPQKKRYLSQPAFSPLERPLRLLPQPVRLQPLFGTVGSDSGSPVSSSSSNRRPQPLPVGFAWDQESFRLVRSWGPERIETRWWKGPATRRDYWRIETSDHRWLWIFRDLRARAWFVHGEF